MKSKITEECIIESLKDAGCECEVIDCFLECNELGNKKEQLRIINQQRRCLLDKVHEEESKIHCLDYLAYKIDKK